MQITRFYKVILCTFAITGALHSPTPQELRNALEPARTLYKDATLGYETRLSKATSEQSLKQLEQKILHAINRIASHEPYQPRQRAAQEAILADLQNKCLEINRKITFLNDEKIAYKLEQSFEQENRQAARQRITAPLKHMAPHQTPLRKRHFRPASGPAPEWQSYDPKMLIDVPKPSAEEALYNPRDYKAPPQHKPKGSPLKRPLPQPSLAAEWPTYNPKDYEAHQPRQEYHHDRAMRARQTIDKRPQAKRLEDYTEIHVPVAGQHGVNCAYHGFLNSKTCAHALTSAARNPLAAIQRTPFEAREIIEHQKLLWNRGRCDGRALDGYELMDFARFNLQSSPLALTFQNQNQAQFFWFILEYMQSTRERNILTKAIKFLNTLRTRPQDITTAHQTLYDQTGSLRWPDRLSPLQAKFRNLAEYRRILNGETSTYLQAIQQFRAGKPIITTFLDHSGRGVGHWTCKCFVPTKRNPEYLSPDFVQIIDMNSSGQSPITADAKRFAWDLLFLELPDRAHLDIINRIIPDFRIPQGIA